MCAGRRQRRHRCLAGEPTSQCGAGRGERTVTEMSISTFERYAERLEVYRRVSAGEIAFEKLRDAIRELDDAVASVEGHGMAVTPFVQCDDLAEAVGLKGAELWVKDETGSVSGSHKARHLFGVALADRLRSPQHDAKHEPPTRKRSSQVGQGLRSPQHDAKHEPPYAIASCGNAALAAAVLARAVGRRLDVYVPTWANEAVVAQITELGGRVVRCERVDGVSGDPAHHRMLEALKDGAVPFSCQGTETPTTIDGARTLAWELVDTLIQCDGSAPARLDRIFVQVGGGALATAVVTALASSAEQGDLVSLPAVHPVQAVGNHPLVRAWDLIVAELSQSAPPESNTSRAQTAQELGSIEHGVLRDVMRRVEQNPQRYMWAWQSEPVSYATGILDDVTYDWLRLIEAMLRSGGWPLVAAEDDLRRAHRVAHEAAGINVCPTGSSGLGGLLAWLAAAGADSPSRTPHGERLAVLFTGRMRPGDPNPFKQELQKL